MDEVKSRVLLVDQDVNSRNAIGKYLSEQGLDVSFADSASQMDRMLAIDEYHLLLLDIKLNGEDGLSVCKRLRQKENHIPIIMKSQYGDEIDRILGLEIGADDFLPDQCNHREMLARLHAVIRRRPIETSVAAPHEITFGHFTLKLDSRKMYKNNQSVAMTSSEFAILQVFANHPNVPLTREKIAALSKGSDHMPSNRAIDVQISRLRRIIETDTAHPDYIQTVWGLGYVFIPEATSPLTAEKV
ncbi:winged helix-turn-helix domain-containing protein [Shewanella waksmanii]|uniref:winged helix-turn-helix domain-containing protein n=1 Tax=Shewanella waksmanii TaxID=213783 RepID=UPI0037354AF4